MRGGFWLVALALGGCASKGGAPTIADGGDEDGGTLQNETGDAGIVPTTPPTSSPPASMAGPNGDKAPSVTLTAPTSNVVRVAPGYFILRATATDADGSIARVDFYDGGVLLGTAHAAPYAASLTQAVAGAHKLYARAIDNQGAATLSAATTITVSPAPNRAPLVVAADGSGAYTTIAAAAQVAMAGDIVLIKPGTYAPVTLTRSGTAAAPITFRAQTPGTVIIDGASKLSGWTHDSGSSPVYSTNWSTDFFWTGTTRYRIETYYDGCLGTEYAEQFFWDGHPLKQVIPQTVLTQLGCDAKVTATYGPGTFWLDWSVTPHRVHVWLPDGADPTSSPVYGTTAQQLFGPPDDTRTTAAYIAVEGIVFRHAAAWEAGAAVYAHNGWRMSNCTIEWSNADALQARGNDIFIDHVTAQFNGQEGIGGGGPHGGSAPGPATDLLMKDSISRYNNQKGYYATWDSGGGKFTNTDGMLIENHTAYHNVGPGIWLDWENTNYSIVTSTLYENWGDVSNNGSADGAGIRSEINDGPGRVDGNIIYNNQNAGIQVVASSGVAIVNNTFVGGNREIYLNKDSRGPLANITVLDNQLKGWSLFGIVSDYDVTSAHLRFDGNTYDGTPAMKVNGVTYAHASDAAAIGQEAHGTSAAVTFATAAPAVGKQMDADRNTISSAIANQAVGATVSLPVIGFGTPHADGSVYAYDLDSTFYFYYANGPGTYIKLSAIPTALAATIADRAFSDIPPVMIHAQLTSVTSDAYAATPIP